MNGNYIIDTNIVIALFNNDNKIIEELSQSDSIAIPSIVVGELFYGAYNSLNQKENLNRIIEFCNDCELISCDFFTANYYGQIKRQLKVSGNPIPENDIWIAAIAMQHKLPLVSRDNHFLKIDNLTTINW